MNYSCRVLQNISHNSIDFFWSGQVLDKILNYKFDKIIKDTFWLKILAKNIQFVNKIKIGKIMRQILDGEYRF